MASLRKCLRVDSAHMAYYWHSLLCPFTYFMWYQAVSSALDRTVSTPLLGAIQAYNSIRPRLGACSNMSLNSFTTNSFLCSEIKWAWRKNNLSYILTTVWRRHMCTCRTTWPIPEFQYSIVWKRDAQACILRMHYVGALYRIYFQHADYLCVAHPAAKITFFQLK